MRWTTASKDEQMPETTSDATSMPDARPAVLRVGAFIVERFPPAPQVVLMLVLFVAATLMSKVLLAPEVGGRLGDVDYLKTAAGLFGAVLFILRLRLADDVKDAETDRVENPTRPIPRGLVTVRELDVAALVLLVVEAGAVAYVGKLAFIAWAIAAFWSLLMRTEFFVPRWLEAHIATYAISHMVVMGLIYGALLAMGIDTRGGEASVGEFFGSTEVVIAMLAATSIGIGFEWGRKFPRYVAAHASMAWVWWIVWPIAGAATFTWLVRDDYPDWSVITLAATTATLLVAHVVVAVRRPADDSELAEMLPGIAGLLTYLVLAIAGAAA